MKLTCVSRLQTSSTYYFGGTLPTQLVFIDPKNYISKIDYNETGPAVVHLKSY